MVVITQERKERVIKDIKAQWLGLIDLPKKYSHRHAQLFTVIKGLDKFSYNELASLYNLLKAIK